MIGVEKQELVKELVVKKIKSGESVLLVCPNEERLHEVAIGLVEQLTQGGHALFMCQERVERHAVQNELLSTSKVLCFPYSNSPYTDGWAISALVNYQEFLSALCPTAEMKKTMLNTWVMEDIKGLLAVVDASVESAVQNVYGVCNSDSIALADVMNHIVYMNEEGQVEEVYELFAENDEWKPERVEI